MIYNPKPSLFATNFKFFFVPEHFPHILLLAVVDVLLGLERAVQTDAMSPRVGLVATTLTGPS